MPYKDPEQRRDYGRRWIAARRAAYFADKACAACGVTDVPMDLDHIDRTAKVSHRIWSWSAARREVELAKCQPLCEPCHVEKTNADFGRTFPHGTRATYRRGCKCDACRGANAAYIRLRAA